MLCSFSELGIDVEADGIIELPLDAPIGTDIREYLALNDVSIDVDLTPNRADCLGIAGLAREIGVLNSVDVVEPTWAPVAATMMPPSRSGLKRRRIAPLSRPCHQGAEPARPEPALDAGESCAVAASAPSTPSSTSPTTCCWNTASRCTPSTWRRLKGNWWCAAPRPTSP